MFSEIRQSASASKKKIKRKQQEEKHPVGLSGFPHFLSNASAAVVC